jgi:plastocyanin
LLKGPSYKAPSANPPAPTASQGTSPTPPVQTEKPVTQVTQVSGQNVITYTDSGYSPSVLYVKVGDIVTFKNESSKSMWPASADHPSHRVYSGTSLSEHCPDPAGNAFDACTGFLPGSSWSFKFNKAGTWKYHDHLNPSATGTIVVE